MANVEADISGVTSQNLAAHLVDIRLPDPVSWWPLAPGWWIIIAAVLLAVAWLLRSTPDKQKNRSLTNQTDQILEQLQTSGDTALYCHRMTRLLREAAIQNEDRKAVARLHGVYWVRWMEDSVGVAFSPNANTLLIDECYRESPGMPHRDTHNELVSWLLQYIEQNNHKHRADNSV